MHPTLSVRTSLGALTLCACSASSGAAGQAMVPADGGEGGLDAGPLSDAGSPPLDTGTPAPDGGTTLTKTYGGRQVLIYVPAKYAASSPAPLVLMLHGCTQSPADFAAGTQMNAQADAAGFVVVYPDQPTSANIEKCWNWFLPADQARSSGEPALLASIVADVEGQLAIDPARVFVAGMSAGAAMAVVLGATYPDLFAAIGVHSGLEYEAATDATSAFAAQSQGGPDPKTQGDLAFSADPGRAGPTPVIVFQGDADTEVASVNGTQIIAQFSETDARAKAAVGPATTTTGSGGGKTFTLSAYKAAGGKQPLLELYMVHGLAHAWSGGSTAGTFTDPAGPNASALIWQFFAAH